MADLADRRLFLTLVTTPFLSGCINTIIGAEGRGAMAAYQPPIAGQLRSAQTISFWQETVTDLGQDISIILGRTLKSGPQNSQPVSLDVEKEISEIIRQLYVIDGDLVAVPFSDISIKTTSHTATELEIQHSAESPTVIASNLSPDARKLLNYFHLTGKSYTWSVSVSGWLKYTTLNPSRYFSHWDAKIRITRENSSDYSNEPWITQETLNSAISQFGADSASRIARMVEVRYGLPKDSVKIHIEQSNISSTPGA